MSSFDDASGPDYGSADQPGPPPLTMEERAGVLDDLAELEVFRTLLEPTGIKGIVVDCPDCDEEHHVDWALMQANLRQLLEEGQTGRHPDRAQEVHPDRRRRRPAVGAAPAGPLPWSPCLRSTTAPASASGPPTRTSVRVTRGRH